MSLTYPAKVAAVQSSAPSAARREHLVYIERFRAIAIILIVAGHAFDLAWFRTTGVTLQTSPATGALTALINGNTFYFVFISGFLYRHIFFERMSYGAFMRKKALLVGLPYLLLGTALAVAQIIASDFHVTISNDGTVQEGSLYVDIMTQLATGQMMAAYWYIPFICLMFVVSPLFDRFIRARASVQVTIWIAAVVLAFWAHRPYGNLSPIHSAAYFGHVYLAGILFWKHRVVLMRILRENIPLLLLGIALLSVALIQDILVLNVNAVERRATDPWWPLAFDWMILQKYIGAFLFCGLLSRFAPGGQKALGFIASNSFGIYFLHGMVLVAMTHAPATLLPHLGIPLIDFIGYAVLAFGITLAAVVTIKTILGEKSRYIIGA